MIWLALISLASAGDTTIEVPAGVDGVRLTCGSAAPIEIAVIGGKATTSVDPSKTCEVELIQRSGTVKLWGDWGCTPGRCAENASAVTATAPGELKITVSDAFNASMLELDCRGGYRERAAIADYMGTFTGVPENDDCTLHFKGGAPGQFRDIAPGAWQCDKQGTAVFCRKQ